MGHGKWRFLLLGLAVCASAASGQENDPGARLLEEQTRREQLEDLAQTGAGQEIETPEIAGVVPEPVCFPIEVIHLKGVTIFDEDHFAALTGEFAGQCLGQASIGNLLQRISIVYADLGYITTRAYVPPQDIGNKELLIEVLEGKLETYVYQQVDEDGVPQAGDPRKIRATMPQQAGAVFQLRDLEHGLETINRLRSSRANANLIAGQAPGTSRIVITEQKADPIRGSVRFDTRGGTESDELQISFNLEADDLLGISDTSYLSYSGTRNSNAVAFSFSAPYRRWLFSASGSYSESLSAVSPNADLFTQTAGLNLTAERLMYRDARSKYFVFGGLHGHWNKRYVNISALTPQHRTALSFGLRHEHRAEKYVLATNTSLKFGAPFLGGDKDLLPLASDIPRAKFAKLETQVTYIRPFENGTQLTVSLFGQLSDDPLYSNEQLSIGGWESVRGYAGYSFSGDNGAFLRAQLSLPGTDWNFGDQDGQGGAKLLGALRGGFRPFLFLDAGYAKSKASRRSSTLLSTGVGFSAQLGKATLDGSIAIPLKSANGQSAGDFQAFLGVAVKIF